MSDSTPAGAPAGAPAAVPAPVPAPRSVAGSASVGGVVFLVVLALSEALLPALVAGAGAGLLLWLRARRFVALRWLLVAAAALLAPALVVAWYVTGAAAEPPGVGVEAQRRAARERLYDASGYNLMRRKDVRHDVIARWVEGKDPGFVERFSRRPETRRWLAEVMQIEIAEAERYTLAGWKDQILLVAPTDAGPRYAEAAHAFQRLLADAAGRAGGAIRPFTEFDEPADAAFRRRVRQTPLPEYAERIMDTERK